MHRVKRWVTAAAGIALLGMGATAPAAMVSFNPSSGAVGVGSTTSVDVVISGLGDGTALSVGVYDFNVDYDASLLSLTGVSFGTGLDVLGLGSLQLSDASVSGTVNVYELSFDLESDLNDLQAGAFTLFTLTFEGLSAGTSALGLTINALGDAGGAALAADVTQGSVQVAPVPLPAAAWLLLSGIGGLGWLGRRKTA